MTAAMIYTRRAVSSTGDEFEALAQQVERCRVFCAAKGLLVIGECADHGTSENGQAVGQAVGEKTQ